MPSRSPSRHVGRVTLLSLVALVFAISFFAFGGIRALRLPAALHTICVTVTVVGEEDVPLDESPCLEGEGTAISSGYSASSVSSASASSAESSEAVSSSSSSAAGTAGGIVSTSEGEGTVTDPGVGGRRGTTERSMERTRELIERWFGRHDRPSAPDNACGMSYSDVRGGSWYFDPVEEFYCKRYLDETPRFRPNERATRAEMAVLLVRMHGGIFAPTPATGGFDDVSVTSPDYPYLEEAARRGWMKGYDNCHGVSRPCYTKPDAPISRAEAAAMVVRFFSLQPLGTASRFRDVPEDAWYFSPVQSAADHCVFFGDDGIRTIRPEDPLNRAEMVAILSRTARELDSGVVCGGGKAAERAPASPVLVRRAAPSGTPGRTNPGNCAEPSMGCLAGAILEDAAVLAESLFAFPLPGREALTDLSTGEPVAWALIVLALSAGTVAGSLEAKRLWNIRHSRRTTSRFDDSR